MSSPPHQPSIPMLRPWFRTAWATVIHMSYEGGGMKLRDLARNSESPTSFVSAFRVLISRLGSKETARNSRGSYESVPILSFIPLRLTFLQQTTMVPVHRIFRRPRYPKSPATFPIRTYHDHRNLHPSAYHAPASSSSITNF